MNKKVIIGILLIIVLSLLLTGCQTTQEGQKDTNEKGKQLKVGAILPLSGSGAVFGENMRRAMELAKEDLANRGINIEIIYEDNKLKPKKSVTAYKKLTNVDNVDVVISIFSRTSVPLVSQAKQDEISLFLTGVAASGLPEESPHIFRFAYRSEQYADILQTVPENFSEMALFYVNDEYGVSAVKDIKQRAEQKGIDIVVEETFNPEQTDYRSQLSKIKQAKPDGIIHLMGVPSTVVSFLKQKKELNIKIPLFDSGTHLSSYRPFVPSLKNLSEGARSQSLPFLLGKTGNEFRTKYQEKYGEEPPGWVTPFGYDTIKLIGKATQGEKLDSSEITQRLRDYGTYESLNGPIKIQDNGEINPPLVPVRVVDGELKEINVSN